MGKDTPLTHEQWRGVTEQETYPDDVLKRKAKGETYLPRKPRAKRYPWRTMAVGTTFVMDAGTSQLRAAQYCSTWSNKLNRRFVFHQYPNLMIEVYRQS